ncbi:MAG: hypothetical protein NTZ50_03330 [Chloroflexi bacterium]|nr:hypothetical protein [Chloroflexota bacterium]
MKILICPDGYLHRMQIEVVGTAKNAPETTASLITEVRIFDFGKDIKIEAPTN